MTVEQIWIAPLNFHVASWIPQLVSQTHSLLPRNTGCLMLSIAFVRWGENPHHLVINYPPQLFGFFSQSTPQPQYPHHCGLRIPECWKIISHREYIGYHPITCFWNLYKVRCHLPLHCNLLAKLHSPALCRCLTECQLLCSNEPWTCVVLLHITTEDGLVLAQPCRVDFGDPITSKADVTEWICCAR